MQHTVLHNVEFTLEVYASFLLHSPPPADRPSTSTSNSHSQTTELSTTLREPFTILPPRAPWRSSEQEIISTNEADLEAHYRKKFDKPPERTIRAPNADTVVGASGGAGGSTAAPPPFEDRSTRSLQPCSRRMKATLPSSNMRSLLSLARWWTPFRPGISQDP